VTPVCDTSGELNSDKVEADGAFTQYRLELFARESSPVFVNDRLTQFGRLEMREDIAFRLCPSERRTGRDAFFARGRVLVKSKLSPSGGLIQPFFCLFCSALGACGVPVAIVEHAIVSWLHAPTRRPLVDPFVSVHVKGEIAIPAKGTGSGPSSDVVFVVFKRPATLALGPKVKVGSHRSKGFNRRPNRVSKVGFDNVAIKLIGSRIFQKRESTLARFQKLRSSNRKPCVGVHFLQ